MKDRFKFKAVLHQNKYEEYQLEKFLHQRVFDVMSINFGIEYSTIDIIAEYPNGDWAVREIDDKDIDLIQCTGLKDKNEKLIYEGDIVKYTSLYSGNLTGEVYLDSETLQYKLKLLYSSGEIYADRDLAYFVNKNGLEKVGNIYENKELLCQK